MTKERESIALLAQTAAANAMPTDLANWLTQLENLVGVPFNYLIPDTGLLPPETIRQFHIDPNWVNALVDGATSIGRHFETPNAYAISQQAEHANLLAARAQTAEMKHMVRDKQLSKIDANDVPIQGHAKAQSMLSKAGLKAPAALSAGAVMTGFILRSQVVKGWPSMDVAGYPAGASPYDNAQDPSHSVTVKPLDVIRLVKLSDDVLFGIFSGELFELVFHQPAEAIHCGFDKINPTATPPNLLKDLRYPVGGWTQESATYKNLSNQKAPNPFHNTSERVVDMAGLSQWMGATLDANGTAPGYYKPPTTPGDTPPAAPYVDHLVSSDFGMEMVQGVGHVSFINKQAPAD